MSNPHLSFLAALAGRPLLLDDRFLAASYGGRSKDAPLFDSIDGVAVVRISGPLMHHSENYSSLDSYDAIRDRVAAAFEARPKAVVLELDSPGGDCAGCFELARDMRTMAAKAGIPLYAAVDGYACSAAYALACSSSRIFAPATAIVGSVGVISGILSVNRALENFGIDYRVIGSGARKGDGHPAKPIDDGAVGAVKGLVGGLADVFFAWVSECRPGMTVESVRALEAGVVLGKDAVAAGLIDQVATLDQVIAIAAGPRVAPTNPTPAKPAGYRDPARRAGSPKESSMPNATSKPRADAESVDLASLREVMEMPDQPGQEVVDAAAARIREDDAEDEAGGEGGEGEGGGESGASAQLAALQAANEQLVEQVRTLTTQLTSLAPLAEQYATRTREDAVDAEMKKRGMPTHDAKGNATASRKRFQDLAAKHGLEVAKDAIDAAHVPPTGTVAGAPPVGSRSTTGAPESGSAPTAAPAKRNLARERAEARVPLEAELAKQHPKASKPHLVALANEKLRATRPDLFPDAASE